MSVPANIARHLPLMAARQPDRPALKIPRGRTGSGDIDYLSLSFAELDTEVNAWAAHLCARGVVPGDRALVMVRQGLPLIAAAFALFKIGAVPVVIDPGMGLKSFLSCVARSRPRVLLGIPFAQIISHLARPSFRSVEVRVAASASPLARRASASKSAGGTAPAPGLPWLRGEDTPPSTLAACSSTDLAAILFTSGSTGAPKGVCYEHGMFEAQVRLIRETYSIEPGEIDLPMLPVFALFNPALGLTTVVPEIDPSHPSRVEPAKIVQAIQQEQVTNSFGSPTLWGKIADHCLAHAVTLPSLRRVLCAGAPVPAALWENSRHFLPKGKLHSPYGATEALPVSTVSSDEIKPGAFNGAALGKPVLGLEVKIIALTDAPIATLAEACELPSGEIGEIIVRGPVVTKTYDALPSATAAAKIETVNNPAALQKRMPEFEGPGSTRVPRVGLGVPPEPSECSRRPAESCTRDARAPRTVGNQTTQTIQTAASFGVLDPERIKDTTDTQSASVWHRMGDCGYLDDKGFLWFCGRKAERVETANGPVFTEPCEQVFRPQAGVARCALIGLGPRGGQLPALVVQPAKKLSAKEKLSLAAALRARGRLHPHTAAITSFFFHPAFPVDVRHNAKIHRLTLAKWAATAKVFKIP